MSGVSPLDQLIARSLQVNMVACDTGYLLRQHVSVGGKQPRTVDANKALKQQAVAQYFRNLVIRREDLRNIIEQRILSLIGIAWGSRPFAALQLFWAGLAQVHVVY